MHAEIGICATSVHDGVLGLQCDWHSARLDAKVAKAISSLSNCIELFIASTQLYWYCTVRVFHTVSFSFLALDCALQPHCNVVRLFTSAVF